MWHLLCSAQGNWTNFRNEKYNLLPYVIQPGEIEQIKTGVIEFDYVSTTRCGEDDKPMEDKEFKEWCLVVLGELESSERVGGVMWR